MIPTTRNNSCSNMFSLHFMLYRGNLDYFSNSVGGVCCVKQVAELLSMVTVVSRVNGGLELFEARGKNWYALYN